MFRLIILTFLFSSQLFIARSNSEVSNIEKVTQTEGLVAFWDFKKSDGARWKSYYDSNIINRSFPLFLRQIGDPKRYTIKDWPYKEEPSMVEFDNSGPFQNAIRFNQGYIYGEVPRKEFDGTLLDLNGLKPFTMIAWVKFEGNRHMVAGIWDEGGWNKYAGRRQAALFAGLFNQKGVIGHVSSTGAASYPQSNVDGAQYARIRAIDGKPFKNGDWVAIAMSFDPKNKNVTAYLNGKSTQYKLADPVTEDVMQNEKIPLANPLSFSQPLYSPRSFLIKYNGYDFHHSTIKEHGLWVDLNENKIEYSQKGDANSKKFRVLFDILREDKSILALAVEEEVSHGKVIDVPLLKKIVSGDKVITKLEQFTENEWQQIGSKIDIELLDGAPFTFGRALGLDEDGLEHGSIDIFIDGVAIFNRILTNSEMENLSFIN
ncbi:hypothetical protein N9O28_02600 [Emcibacteraceae bacterium]|nr:hypothetical protein [Emcibacteraceae bacterium]